MRKGKLEFKRTHSSFVAKFFNCFSVKVIIFVQSIEDSFKKFVIEVFCKRTFIGIAMSFLVVETDVFFACEFDCFDFHSRVNHQLHGFQGDLLDGVFAGKVKNLISFFFSEPFYSRIKD